MPLITVPDNVSALRSDGGWRRQGANSALAGRLVRLSCDDLSWVEEMAVFETTAGHKWPTPTGTRPVQNHRKTSSVRNGCATVIPPKRFRPEFKDTGGSSHKRQNTTKRSSCCSHRASRKAPAYAMQQRTIPIKRIGGRGSARSAQFCASWFVLFAFDEPATGTQVDRQVMFHTTQEQPRRKWRQPDQPADGCEADAIRQ